MPGAPGPGAALAVEANSTDAITAAIPPSTNLEDFLMAATYPRRSPPHHRRSAGVPPWLSGGDGVADRGAEAGVQVAQQGAVGADFDDAQAGGGGEGGAELGGGRGGAVGRVSKRPMASALRSCRKVRSPTRA